MNYFFFLILIHYKIGSKRAVALQLQHIFFYIFLYIRQVFLSENKDILINLALKGPILRDKSIILFGVCL